MRSWASWTLAKSMGFDHFFHQDEYAANLMKSDEDAMPKYQNSVIKYKFLFRPFMRNRSLLKL